jgi:uncharacterized membrane protein YdjX (TVP38/TMEM64 family)
MKVTEELNHPGVKGSRLTAWAGLVLAFVLVPFALFGTRMEALSLRLLASGDALSDWHALAIITLLVLDVLLPVPSSIVSTIAGADLGAVAGTIASWIGMTLGSMVGYWIGLAGGRRVAARVVGRQDWDLLSDRFSSAGIWMVVVTRPVPALAEAMLLAAGSARIPFGRFFVATASANLAISTLYASVGARMSDKRGVLLAFAVALLTPAVSWYLHRRSRRRCVSAASLAPKKERDGP